MTIPPEAVEAACKAMIREDSIFMSLVSEDGARDLARVALIAAAPFIRAQVIEECAKVAAGAINYCQQDNDINLRTVRHRTVDAILALIPAETKET